MKLRDALLFVDNNKELEAIENSYPTLKNSKLVLLSDNFSEKNISSYNGRNYCYFDKYITVKDSILITQDIQDIVWSWFLDKNGKDISSLYGCSLGSSFSHSVEIILNTTFKYLVSFRKILAKESLIYCSSEAEGIFLDTIKYLQQEIGFNLHVVDTKNTSTIVTQGKRNIRMDVRGRYRDHSKVFLYTSIKQAFVFNILLTIQRMIIGSHRKKVLFVPAGKHESLFRYIRKNIDTFSFGWVIPLEKFKDLLSIFRKKINFFYLSSTGIEGRKDVERIIINLKDNIMSKNLEIDKYLLTNILNRHIFIYFHGAYNYFNNTLKALDVLSPDLIILSSESSESFILIGQAAKKLNIKTAFLPHGIYGIGRSQYKTGRFSWIDYGFALGELDKEKFIISKMPKNNIYSTGHPYFEKFFPIKSILRKKYKNVVVIAPDAGPRKSWDKISYEQNFYKDIFQAMESIEIDIVCVKVRDSRHLKSRSMGKSIKAGSLEVPIIAEENLLTDVITRADFVIGPISTAIMEVALMGLDYYVYDNKDIKLLDDFELCTQKYMNISNNQTQLIQYIEMKTPYSDGHSVNDLIDLKELKTKKDIFKKLEDTIESILDKDT
jgi:hypothetical protein